MDVAALTALSSARASQQLGALDPSSPATPAQAKQVAAQFEAILVRQMLSKSVGSMLGGEEKDQSVAGSVYGDMMTDVLAQKLTAGGGLGMARLIEQQLTPHAAHPAASPATASDTLQRPSS
jgi:flagellar protein FlgJ